MQHVGGMLAPDNASITLSDGYKLQAKGHKEVKMTYGTVADIATYWPGWQLCDGSNGTPDLRDRFIIGARQDSSGAAKTNVTGALTQSGGAATVVLTKGNIPAHVHTYTRNVAPGAGDSGGALDTESTENTGDGTADGLKTSPDAVNILNPYYALCFITKV